MWKISTVGTCLGKTVSSAIVIGLATCGIALAQDDPPVVAPEVLPFNTGGQNIAITNSAVAFATNCRLSRTNGSGVTAFNWCFSDDGNVVSIEHSEGLEHVNNGTITEGFCLAAASSVRGITYGTDPNVGLEPPTYPSSTRIQHKTIDGEFRIEQRFVQSAGGKEVIIIMKVVNISSSPINDVFLTRFIDPDMSNTTSDDMFIAASRSVAALEPGSTRLELIPKTENFNANSLIYADFLPELDGDCYDATADNLDEVGPADRSMGVHYQLGTIFPGSSKTVRFVYHISI